MRKSRKGRHPVRVRRMKVSSGGGTAECFKALTLLTVIWLVSASLVFGYSSVVTSAYFRIKTITVHGLKELTEKEILRLAEITSSHTLFSVNLQAMANRISSHPWIREVAIAREFPDRLTIEVGERKALALLRKGDDFYILDQEGVFFKKLETTDEVDVPVLTGFNRQDGPNRVLLQSTAILLDRLRQSGTFPGIDMISEIQASEREGISLITRNGLFLKLGFDNFEDKLERLLPVLATLKDADGYDGFIHVDLRNRNKIYVERKNIGEPADRRKTTKGFST